MESTNLIGLGLGLATHADTSRTVEFNVLGSIS